MGRDRHAWEDRCQDEAALAPMGTLDTPTARAARAPQPCHGISARAQAQRPSNPDKAWRPSNAHAWHASQPATCHDAMTAHGLAMTTQSKSLATSQAKQAQRANRQRSAITQMATTSGGAPPPLPVLGGERKRKGHRVEGAPPPMEVQAAAAPPWTAADDGKVHEVS
ncbi:hypothetical protein CJ030_MR6G023572 [Morella rubra]|uniref:Uncharacterized protein n=1 Tax=Morella rubra TaxID=262757 RepID=A0A6A1VB97_9ROSI|nr:hypothetical protein CJ030_MR6G023572 [Morella rubra]